MDVTLRLTLNWHDALILENLLNGISPYEEIDVIALGEIKTRLQKNIDKHRAAQLLEEDRKKRMNEAIRLARESESERQRRQDIEKQAADDMEKFLRGELVSPTQITENESNRG